LRTLDSLSWTFAALADPTRRAILGRLAEGEASVGDLAEPFEISLPAISRHLKVLERASLIRRQVDAKWRLCRIDPKGLRRAMDWIEVYHPFREQGLDSLDKYLEEQVEKETTSDSDSTVEPRRGG
jgi:DNA-binding transcriptional ArsR family regulator